MIPLEHCRLGDVVHLGGMGLLTSLEDSLYDPLEGGYSLKSWDKKNYKKLNKPLCSH